MSELKKQQMLKKIEDLRFKIDCPNFHISNYFEELRNKVDVFKTNNS